MDPTHHVTTTADASSPAAPTMTVRVPDWAANWGGPRSAPHPLVRTLTIAAECPACGAERGAPRPHRGSCDGEEFYVDAWTNACGHIDYYEAVLTEAGIVARAPAS